MKNLFIIALAILTLSGCKKDPCEDIFCQNGGTCIEGDCLCINGYFGNFCEIAPNSNQDDDDNTDPCDNVTCFNDGYCANGVCVCTQGYTGADCSQQDTPSTIKITKIVVTSFPATDDGAGWDLTSGADIYPQLFIGTSTEVWASPTFSQNANPNLSYEFTPSPAISLDPSEDYVMRLYDYDDFDADDFMGLTVFSAYSSTNDFPDVLYPSYQEVSFEVHLDYTW